MGLEVAAEDLEADLGKIHGAGQASAGTSSMKCWICRRLNPAKWEFTTRRLNSRNLSKMYAAQCNRLVVKYDNTLKTEYHMEDSNIRTDVTKFRQILMNLLSNAAKFTRDGSITINAHRFMEKRH